MTTDFESEAEEFDEGPSKSQRKRDMHVLQDLGRELTELKASQLAGIELPDELREAIIEIERIRQREAKRRQLQRIGRLMQLVDGDDIAAQLTAIKSQGTLSVQRQHVIERWRDELLSDDNDALSRFITEYPDTDIQHLRQLIRQANKKQPHEKATTNSRKLFRYIRDTLAQND
ncbi:ribosome biogenesis factor YjgA [Gilvimarinus polysaccharolyticus]|uniref:ribosome biogenesis factor YjgA n=1 Tax=Gilvimarinus polysaccharolyticus TaxID=863921 RepID=UPI000673B76E|nr:ribosome biogenesis factor YjgA [Gilvimarinus polysaccharolyticus]